MENNIVNYDFSDGIDFDSMTDEEIKEYLEDNIADNILDSPEWIERNWID